MFKIVLLSLALTGLQALPISRRLTKTHHNVPVEVRDGPSVPLSEGFRQGTEPSRRFIVDLNTGLVQDYISEMNRRTGLLSSPLGNGHGEMSRNHRLRDNTAEEVLVQKNGGGWVRVEHTKLPDGFRQGTEPSRAIPEGFRQGTEPAMPIREGYRQGTERFMPIPDGFRQGTEPSMRLQDGFRQGTEPSLGIQNGFRQGTERFLPLPGDFRQGTEPSQSLLEGFRQGTEPTNPENRKEAAISFKAKVTNALPSGFRQGTERSNLIPLGFRQGTERVMPIPAGFRQGTEPSQSFPDGFRQGTEPKNPDDYRRGIVSFKALPEVSSKEFIGAFRPGVGPFMPVRDGNTQDIQGIEKSMQIPDGFRQGTEPSDPADYRHQIIEAFRPGVGPFMPVRDGNRPDIQGMPIPEGFRQGTEPSNPADYRNVPISFKDLPEVSSNQIVGAFRPDIQGMPIPDGFRQGTEPSNPADYRNVPISFEDPPAVPSNQIIGAFRPGVGPFMPVRDGNSQDTQPSNHIHAIQRTNTARCNGEVINGRCYTFNPTPMPFLEAQDSCKSLNPSAELAAVTNEDLHSRLVSMVTKGGQRDPVMTWLGGTVKNQRGSWLDGSEWRYSDWMPGQPNIHTSKPVCVEMFRMDESWWTAADCDLKRASICSYPVS